MIPAVSPLSVKRIFCKKMSVFAKTYIPAFYVFSYALDKQAEAIPESMLNATSGSLWVTCNATPAEASNPKRFHDIEDEVFLFYHNTLPDDQKRSFECRQNDCAKCNNGNSRFYILNAYSNFTTLHVQYIHHFSKCMQRK